MPGGTLYADLVKSTSMPQVDDLPLNPNWLPVLVRTTADIPDLAAGAPNTVDGVQFVAGDRIGVVAQTDPKQNGIYRVVTPGSGANGAWVRASDFDSDADLVIGRSFYVQQGTLYGQKTYTLLGTGVLTLGGSNLNFESAQTLMTSEMRTGFQQGITLVSGGSVVFRWFPRQSARITAVELFTNTQVTSAGGTVLLTAARMAGGTNIFAAANYDIETLAANTRTAMGLHGTATNLDVTTAQYVDFTFASTVADVAGGVGLTLIVSARPTT